MFAILQTLEMASNQVPKSDENLSLQVATFSNGKPHARKPHTDVLHSIAKEVKEVEKD